MLLLDSDAIKKLAQYGLLQELIDAYGVEAKDFYVLPELKYQLHLNDRKKAISKLGSEPAYDSLTAFLGKACEVQLLQVDAANEILLLDQSNLDLGEQTLLAVVVSNPSSRMISGDKRAFIAISKVSSLSTIHQVWPRLICLEEALLVIVQGTDFKTVSAKVRARSDVDSAIKIAFGVSAPADEINVVSALKSYIADLVNKTEGFYQPKIAMPTLARF